LPSSSAVRRSGACGNRDSRGLDAYQSAGTTARALGISGALIAVSGLLLWGFDLLDDEAPRLQIQ